MAAELIPLRPIVTAQAPKPNLSGEEIAAPFTSFSKALTASGSALGTASEELAQKAGEEEGRKSVRVDDSGNLVVSDTRNPFIIGPAAGRYERAAKMTQLAQMQPKIETDMLKLRLDHPNDPGGFAAAASGYATTMLNGDPDKGVAGIQDPAIRSAVSDILRTNQQHNERTSLVEANAHNTSEALQTYQAQIKGLSEEMSSLARQGAGSAPKDSDAYKTFSAKAKDLATFYSNLQGDPRFKFSKERAQLELDEHYAGFNVQDVIGKVQRQFMEDKDLPKATQSLIDGMWGPDAPKNLKASQRDHGVSEGLAHLRNLAAGDHDEIQQHRKAVASFVQDNIEKPGLDFPVGEFNNLRKRAEDLKDKRSTGALDEFKEMYPLAKTMLQGGPERRSQYLNDMRQGITPFFRLQSSFDKMLSEAPPEVQQGVSIFSGMRSTEHQAELYAAAVKRYGSEEEARKWVAPPGHSQHEKGNAADLRFATPEARQWMHDNAGKYGLTFPLSNEPWHIETAGARTGTVGGLVEGKQVDLTASTYAGSMFQKLTKVLETKVSKDSEDALNRIEKNAKEGAAVMPDDVQHFAEMATRSGRQDLLEKGQTWLLALDEANNRPRGETFDQRTAWVAEQRSKGMTPMQADTLDHFEAITKAHDERFNANPRAEAAAMGIAGAPAQLSFNASDAGELARREKTNRLINQQMPNTGSISAIMPGEAKQLATVLNAGDPKQADDFLKTLRSSLPPDTYRATMESDGVKSAMVNMFNSNVPARLDAAGMALEKLWDTNSQDFEAKYGGHTADRVNQWKALQSVDNVTRAKRMSSTENPQNEKELAEKVEKEVKDITPQKVADSLGNFLQRNVPLFHGPLPQDIMRGNEMAGIAMKNDFTRAYKSLREVGSSPADAQELAVQRIGAQWRPSEMLGNRLMKNAPESFYPADPINKDHAWMMKQLEAEISSVHGSTFAVSNTGGILPGWQLKGIVADNQTQREAESFDKSKSIGPGNLPPSYQVHIVDEKGQDQIYGGVGKRYYWDPAKMLAEGEASVAKIVARRQLEAGIFGGRMRNRQLGFNPALSGEIPGEDPGLKGPGPMSKLLNYINPIGAAHAEQYQSRGDEQPQGSASQITQLLDQSIKDARARGENKHADELQKQRDDYAKKMRIR